MALTESIVRWRYRLVPDHVLGEILTKRWIDNAIPVLILFCVMAVFGSIIPDFFGAASISNLMRQWGEFGLIVLALMIVMVAGGIDLSVGSTFALGNIVALALISVAGWPVWAVVVGTMAAGATDGSLSSLPFSIFDLWE